MIRWVTHTHVYIYIYIHIELSIYLSIYLFIYLSIYLFIYLSIYLFIYLSCYIHNPEKNAARGGLKRKQSVHKGNKATPVVTVSLLLKPTDLSALTNHRAPLPAQQPSRLYHKAKTVININ